jgi:hypothetical protein
MDRGVLVLEPDAMNYFVGNSIHSNGLLGVEHAAEVQTAPQIVSAIAVGDQTFVRVKLDSPRREGCCHTYAVSLFAGSFADASGAGEGHTPVGTFFTAGGNSVGEIAIERNLAGKFLSATAALFDLFTYYGAGTTSQFGRAVQVTADICSPDAPSPSAPDDGEQAGDETRFAWNGVAGAALYILWSMRPGDMPRRLWEGSATEATLSLLPGRYEWWVEARFDHCYGTQSSHRYLTKP